MKRYNFRQQPSPPAKIAYLSQCCDNCKFWVHHTGQPAKRIEVFGEEGGCHRNPPVVDAGWPTTSPSDWCGAWEGRYREPGE